MSKYYCCRVGAFTEDSHFYKTFHQPIVEKKYNNIRWAVNKVSLHKKTLESINRDINNEIKIYIILFPNKPKDYPYAICELDSINERNLGPLIEYDETNDDRGWTNETSYGYNDFTYDFKFRKIYKLNMNSFNQIKLKGQKTFFELKLGNKNELLLKQIEKEIKFIEIYVDPIICSI